MLNGYDDDVQKWRMRVDENNTVRAYQYWDWFSKDDYARSEAYELKGKGDIKDFIIRENGAGFLLYVH